MRPLLMSVGAKVLLDGLSKAFDEMKHPRHPKGSAEGGRFAPAAGSRTGDDKAVPEPIYLQQRRADPPQVGRDYWHVAHGWKEGEPLLCYDKVEQQTGAPPKWKWEGEPFDTDIVSLHDNLPEARDFQQHFGGRLLRIHFPDEGWTLHEMGLSGGVNYEGYPFIMGHIPPEYITPADEEPKP